jgi:MipA family protein
MSNHLVYQASPSTKECRDRRKAHDPRSLLRAVIIGLAGAMTFAIPVAAQPVVTLPAPPITLPFLPSPSGDWTLTIGAGGKMQPDYVGAKHSMFSPVPIFSVHRAGSAEKFRGPRDGASIALFDYGGFRAGPVGKIVSSRKASRYTELTGLGDVGIALEIGGFVEYFPVDWFRTRVEVRQGFGGHHGVVADFSGDFIVPLSQQWTVSGGPRFTLEDAKATSPYFGVSLAQSLASGLPIYNAKGGAHSAGAGAQVRYQYNPQWEIHSYVEYERLLGNAASSPVVTLRGSPNQVTVGIGASYSFDVRVQ